MKTIQNPISVLLLSACFFFLTVNSSGQVPVTSGGTGAPDGSGLNGANNAGGNATGLGCGGGGGSWWGGTGGYGKFGGGGGGAGGYFSLGSINWLGGDGGQGVVVVAYFNGATLVSAQVLVSGTSVTVPVSITSAKVWAIGGGGGAGGATANDGTSGGGGGAGGTAYVTKAVSPGDIITYSIGSGGAGGHGASNGSAGGNTSATIAGTTIYGNGGAGGYYNNATNATGGTYSGGDGGANGGYGYGRTGDVGGGGGGAVGGANGMQNGNSGGNGASAVDVSGLFAACAISSNPVIPAISDFTPKAGLAGTVITVTGNGFTGATAAKVGGVAASSFTVVSDNQVTVTVAAGSVSGAVSITLPTVVVSKSIYLFQTPPVPTISGFSPASAQRGQVVTISGSNFLSTTSVTLGGTAALSFTPISDYSIEAVVGSGTSGNVVVANSSGSASYAGFTWVATTQASAISFSSVQSAQMTISWTNGTAAKRAVFVKAGTGAITDPVINTTYTASTNWSSRGTELGTSGYYCVYNGTGNSVTITNLSPSTQYTVQVFEYNGAVGKEVYFTSTTANNPNSQLTNGVLPLQWTSFTVKPGNNNHLLEWATCNEINTKDFVVQHSINSANWEILGYVNAAGNNASYSFLHNNPSAGNHYYRLVQRDIDDRYSYSRVISLYSGSNSLLRVYPNPSEKGAITIWLQQAATVSMYNLSGSLVYRKVLAAGQHIPDLSGIAAGTYWLRAGDASVKLILQ